MPILSIRTCMFLMPSVCAVQMIVCAKSKDFDFIGSRLRFDFKAIALLISPREAGIVRFLWLSQRASRRGIIVWTQISQ